MEVPKYIGWPALALSAYGILWFLAGRSVFYPFKYPLGRWELKQVLSAEDAWIEASDGVKLHGWWIGPPEAVVTTLHLHGNGGNITHRAAIAREIVRAGSAVLLLDYRGYGRSEGKPSEAGLYRDGEAAYDYLIAKGVSPKRLVIHGESLGSAIAVDLAIRKPSAGLVLEAPFPSARAVAARVLPGLGPLLIGGFDSKSKIQRLGVPLLLIHGDRDEVIDYELGRELFQAAPEPKRFWSITGAGHNNLLETAGDEYQGKLAEFYRSIL